MPKRRSTILWLSLLLLILIAAVYGWYLYQKPHASAAGERVAVTIDADSLFYQYQADEHAADLKYMGKVLSVTGKLSEIQHSGNSVIWILSTQPGGGGINCQLFPGTVTGLEPKKGDAVTVKGRCTGFLMDVNLSDCVPDK
jgi:hypothetical protein